MREDKKSRVRGIEEVIKAAHRGRNLPKLPASFSDEVMREIKQIGRIETECAEGGRFSREYSDPSGSAPAIEAAAVWKFAAAAALITIVVCGYFLSSASSGVNCELAEFATGDSASLILAHSLALI